MTPERVYRLSIWLPLVVPVLLIVVMNVLFKGFGIPKPSGFLDVALESIAGSAFVGGLPYLVLALVALRWMRGRSEREIQRLMLVAPLLMVAMFTVFALVVGVLSGNGEVWLGLAGGAAGIIILLGYGYVALTMLLRRLFASPAGAGGSSLQAGRS